VDQNIQLGVSQGQPGENPLVVKRKNELLMYVQSFYRRSWDWRSQRFHSKWDRNDRDYNSIYDPVRAAQKEEWQEKIHTGLTVQNIEVIHSQVYKTMMAPRPPVQTLAGPAGDDLQARLMQDCVADQFQKGQYDIGFYDTSKEGVKYGSGFMKMYWEKIEDTRRRRTAVPQSPQQQIASMPPEAITGAQPLPPPSIQSYQMQNQQVLIKDQMCYRYVHIRDIFPEPNTTTWDKVIHRDKITYGEIVKNITTGAFFDVRAQLENVTEGEKFEQDLTTIKQELGYFDTPRTLSKFEKKHTVWELWCPIPRKWIDFAMPDGDEAEVLVPGKVMVASSVALLASEENYLFDGESPILKMDYIRTGQTYGMGVCDLIGDDQPLSNEIISSRIDNLNLILHKGVAVVENGLVNADEDMVVKPGWVLRFKQMVDDVRKFFVPIEFQDVTASAYRENIEVGLRVQEKTGANKVTLGTSSQVTDTNQTLGGMELLKQMFNERIAALGMVIESSFLVVSAKKTYGCIYQRFASDPEGLRYILGDDLVTIGELPNPMGPDFPPVPHQVPRYLAFAFVPPEVVNNAYIYKPMGIFSMENKIVKSAQVMDMIKLNMGNPGFDTQAASKYLAVDIQGINEAEKWFRPIPMIPIAMIPPELLPMILPPPGGGSMNKKNTPGMKSGPNGTGATFSPPNPVNRQPVVA
jgi:hypothetical protein